MKGRAHTHRHTGDDTGHPYGHGHLEGRGHGHGHGHEHGRGHPEEHHHGHGHGHPHGNGRWARVRLRAARLFTPPHSHETSERTDRALESSARGIRALWISLAALGATAVAQAAVAAVSGSVALLGDSVHNAADALTALPLGIAFVLGRRAPTRRFTYGYGRIEDLAGLVIVLTILASAVFAAVSAVDRLLDPRAMHAPWAVAAAAVVGFLGNEWVARYRIRVGRAIGSAALVADGLHARTDGFASLAVLLGVGGQALGWRLADPLVGLLITAAILLVLRDAAREVLRRVTDAVDPGLVDTAEQALRRVPGVEGIGELRLRWIGHRLRAEVAVVVDGTLSLRQAHHVAVETEHALLHALPGLSAALVHADPAPAPGESDPHLPLAHHATA